MNDYKCYNCGCPVPKQHLKTVDGDVTCDECHNNAKIVRKSLRRVPTCWNCRHSFGSGRGNPRQYCDRGHRTVVDPDEVCDLHLKH